MQVIFIFLSTVLVFTQEFASHYHFVSCMPNPADHRRKKIPLPSWSPTRAAATADLGVLRNDRADDGADDAGRPDFALRMAVRARLLALLLRLRRRILVIAVVLMIALPVLVVAVIMARAVVMRRQLRDSRSRWRRSSCRPRQCERASTERGAECQGQTFHADAFRDVFHDISLPDSRLLRPRSSMGSFFCRWCSV